jgi:hypothetical protein
MINHAKKVFSLLNLLECVRHSSFSINDKHSKKKAFTLFSDKCAVGVYSSTIHIISRIRQLLLDSVQESFSMRTEAYGVPDSSPSSTTEYVNSINNTKLIHFLLMQSLEKQHSVLFLISLLLL